MELKATVVIPAYNSEETIEYCLSSLKEQDAEIIVVDDSSTDNTVKICEKYNVKIISVKSKSAAKARNIGVENSKGDIILFTDSDCIPDKNWVSVAKKCFEKLKTAEIIGGSIEFKKDTIFQKTYAKMYEIMDRKNFRNNSILLPTMNLAVRKEVFSKIYFDPSLPSALCEDVDFLYNAKKKNIEIRYCEKMTIKHLNPYSIKQFIKQEIRHGKGRALLMSKHNELISEHTSVNSYNELLKNIFLEVPNHFFVVIKNAEKIDKYTLLSCFLHYFRMVIGNAIYVKYYKKFKNHRTQEK